MIDKIAEKLASIFGSGPFIIFHIIWFTIWIVLNAFIRFDHDYSLLTIIVSLEAIFLSLFILRAENIQSTRLENMVKEDLKKTKQEEVNTRKILKKIDKK